MWRLRQIATLFLAWILLIVTLFSAHNIGRLPDPTHNTKREFPQRTNGSEEIYHQTPPDDSEPESLSQRNLTENESEIGRRMNERRQRVQAVCKIYQPYNNVLNTIVFRDYFFHNYNTTVCLIAKVGSFTISNFFLQATPLLFCNSRYTIFAIASRRQVLLLLEAYIHTNDE